MAGWFTIGIIVSIVSGNIGKRHLLKEFRSAVLGAKGRKTKMESA